jgi:flagellin
MISVNTNTASSMAAYNLNRTSENLQRSLQKLSSGSRINSSFDDAGGLAVSMKLSASIRRTEATQANVNNALSFLQTQDGVLKNAEKVVVRMAELASLATDVTKSGSDRSLYQTEVNTLKQQLNSMLSDEFNGVRLFGSAGLNNYTATTDGSIGTAGTLAVYTSEDGGQSVAISQLDFGYLSSTNGVGAIASPLTTGGIQVGTAEDAADAVGTLVTAIQNLATLRATNGSEQSRLTFATDMLAINKVNLESANSRIVDLDLASESSNMAKWNILQQAGTAMLAQANQSTQSVLRLLM